MTAWKDAVCSVAQANADVAQRLGELTFYPSGLDNYSVSWHPSTERAGSWHVLIDGWAVASSHKTRDEAELAMLALTRQRASLPAEGTIRKHQAGE